MPNVLGDRDAEARALTTAAIFSGSYLESALGPGEEAADARQKRERAAAATIRRIEVELASVARDDMHLRAMVEASIASGESRKSLKEGDLFRKESLQRTKGVRTPTWRDLTTRVAWSEADVAQEGFFRSDFDSTYYDPHGSVTAEVAIHGDSKYHNFFEVDEMQADEVQVDEMQADEMQADDMQVDSDLEHDDPEYESATEA